MNRNTFLGIFLIIIGAIGLIVGLTTHHFNDSTAGMIGYLLPVFLGVVMVLVERVGK